MQNVRPVRRFFEVENFVDGERAGLAETLSAVGALERLLLGVNVAVVAQVVLPPEGLAAHVAGEGPLVGVCPLVYQQVVGLGELPVAELANETLLWSRGPAGASKESWVVGGGRRVVGGG